jgi:hypothetical protein
MPSRGWGRAGHGQGDGEEDELESKVVVRSIGEISPLLDLPSISRRPWRGGLLEVDGNAPSHWKHYDGGSLPRQVFIEVRAPSTLALLLSNAIT